ncbi:MAG: ABC transporter ATP-binding protein [Carnobacterium alterfunditum]
MIKLTNIYKRFSLGEGTLEVLNNINIEIKEGEFVAIMGPSGSGKSTLMNIIGCLDNTTTGNYQLFDEEIALFDSKKLAKIRNLKIGFVFQQYFLLSRLNVIKNIELPLIYAGINKYERTLRVHSVLQRVNLIEKKLNFPNTLSGGQKQRIAIARALVNTPKIILADEPTGALDSVTSSSIMDIFRELNLEGTTIILVTHDYEIAKNANRIITMKDGSIISDIGEKNEF